MSETSWIAIAGIVATLVGTLLASFIATRGSRETLREQFRLQHQQTLRSSIARALVAARAWGDVQNVSNMVMAGCEDYDDFRRYMDDLPNSYTGDQLRNTRIELDKAYTDAILGIGDDELISAFDELKRRRIELSEVAFRELTDSLRSDGDKVQRMVTVTQKHAMYEVAILRIEGHARLLLGARAAQTARQ